jgi:prolyl oligopeptidase
MPANAAQPRRRLPPALLTAVALAVPACVIATTHRPDKASEPMSHSADKTSLVLPASSVPAGVTPATSRKPAYPASRREETADVLHGVTVKDPYRWLEQEKAPEVQAWMQAQDDLARKELAALPERAGFAKRLKELLYLDALGVPFRRGDRLFYGQRHKEKEKSLVYWRPLSGAGGEPRVLFDPNTWSKDLSEGLGGYTVSWDGKLVAYQRKSNNSDEATLHVMEVESGRALPVDVIPGAKYASPSWTPDGSGFYYTWLPTDPAIPAADRPGHAEVRFHELGTDPKTDALVHAKTGDPTAFHGVDLSRDGRWLLYSVQHGWTSNDLFLRDLQDPAGVFKPVVTGKSEHYETALWAGKLFIKTTDGAPLGRIVVADAQHPEPANWKVLVPERPGQPMGGFSIVGGHLAVVFLRDATERIELFTLEGKPVREQALPGLGSTSGMIGLEDDDTAYFSYESFNAPRELQQVSVKTGETKLLFRLQVPADTSQITVEQRFATSRDGTRVPYFVVAKKSVTASITPGAAPVIINGYGGFLSNETPYFSAAVLAWLERGGVWVSGVLRGGGEYGEPWHQDGMRQRKQNVFDDLFAVGEALVKTGVTTPAHLGVSGGSNGGLLVGAAVAQRPDLFRVALCGVPLLDMVRYHQFGSGATWISEYGSSADAEQFKALYAWSPYHHINANTAYPATLVLSADSDDRVDPMHARKFAAALQAASIGGPVLLRIERNAGHGGADKTAAAVEQLADEYAFAWEHLAAR